MNQRKDEPQNAPLNPALKSETETVYETKVSSLAPIETTSAKEDEGEGWPIVWLLVTFAGIAVALFLLF
jgi:hypothetical protein